MRPVLGAACGTESGLQARPPLRVFVSVRGLLSVATRTPLKQTVCDFPDLPFSPSADVIFPEFSNKDSHRNERTQDTASRKFEGRDTISGPRAFAAIENSLRQRNFARGGIAAAKTAGGRRNQDRQSYRRPAHGRVGRNCGWKSQRAHRPALETIRTERCEINLGRRSRRCFALAPRESQSTGDGATHARGTGEIA